MKINPLDSISPGSKSLLIPQLVTILSYFYVTDISLNRFTNWWQINLNHRGHKIAKEICKPFCYESYNN